MRYSLFVGVVAVGLTLLGGMHVEAQQPGTNNNAKKAAKTNPNLYRPNLSKTSPSAMPIGTGKTATPTNPQMQNSGLNNNFSPGMTRGGVAPMAYPGMYPNAYSGMYPNAYPGMYPNAYPGMYPNAYPGIYPNMYPNAYPGMNPYMQFPGFFPGY